MPEGIQHKSETLKSAFDLIETPDTGIIVAGGPSDSQLLNKFKDGIIEDIVELDRRTRDQAEQLSLTRTVFNTQIDTLQARIVSLTASLPTTTGQWFADFFSNDFQDGSNTADFNNTYGQATLPILSNQEKLVAEDSRGNIWIPKGAQVTYSYKSTTPAEVDWLTDENTTHALDQRADTAWFRTRPGSGTIWVRVRVPVNLNANKLANCIILHPYPTLHYDLLSVEYRSPAGVYTTADLSYLEGWDSGAQKVAWFGNVRIFIPQSQVTELRIKMSTQGAGDILWGFSRISLQQIEFSPVGTLVVDFLPYNPQLISTVTLHGKDPDSLSFLTTTITGTKVSVGLNQNSQNNSPIITVVEINQ